MVNQPTIYGWFEPLLWDWSKALVWEIYKLHSFLFSLSHFCWFGWWIFPICCPGLWSRADGSSSGPGLLQSLPVWDLQQWQRASRSLARHLWGLESGGCRDLAELCLHCPVSSSATLTFLQAFDDLDKHVFYLVSSGSRQTRNWSKRFTLQPKGSRWTESNRHVLFPVCWLLLTLQLN